MAEKKETSKAPAPVMRPVEEWAKEKGVDPIFYEGAKVSMGWKSGKAVTEKDFDAAMDGFINGPADGRK